MARYRATRVSIDHPLARMNASYSKRTNTVQIWEHRAVMWDVLGAGPHLCHWCGRGLRWGEGTGGDILSVDHLDRDPRNNDPTNLVPACMGCNAHRHHPFALVSDDEPYAVNPTKGTRQRGRECVCLTCGATFVRTHAALRNAKRNVGRYCSLPCMYARNRS